MAHITVPADFFRGELRVYGDWRLAFARELLQNATDASPSRIDITLSQHDGHGRVEFVDDGHGMTREVLEEVFFALGRTTKTGADSIGGFGRARIIICFAQTAYTLHTGHLFVTGRGGEYTIREVAEYQRGCKFVIDLLDEDCDQVRYAFERLLRQCTLDVPVTINGFRADTAWLPNRATRILRDSDGSAWARIYVTPDSWSGLQVRVRGLMMFDRYIGGPDGIVLELDPKRAREVLAASRDTLHTVFDEQLNRFVSDLTQNRRRALRPPAEPLDLRVGGGGFLFSDSTTVPGENQSGTNGHATVNGGADVASQDSEDGSWVRLTPANTAAFVNAAANQLGAETWGHFEEPEVPSLGFDVFLLADANDARVRRLTRAWNPASWDRTTGARRRALLLAWKAAAGHVLDVFLAQHDSLGRVAWTVGWTFDTDVQAVHKNAGNGHVFALNPVTEDGVSRYRVSQRADRAKLLAIAAHEVVHVVEQDHNERFAGMLTDLFGALDAVTADRIMRDAIHNG